MLPNEKEVAPLRPRLLALEDAPLGPVPNEEVERPEVKPEDVPIWEDDDVSAE